MNQTENYAGRPQAEESVFDYLKHNIFQILYFRNIQVHSKFNAL